MGAGELEPELPSCARMEKFGGGILPAVGHVGKVGETDHAGSVGSWGPRLWGGVEGKTGHTAMKRSYVPWEAVPRSYRGPRK